MGMIREKGKNMEKWLTGMEGHSGLYPGECWRKITLQATNGRMKKSGEFRWEAIPNPRNDDEVWPLM